MRGRNERIGRAAVIAALLLSGCGQAHDREDTVVAEAYQEKLYRSDLVRMIPPDAPKEDSAALAQRFIDGWAHERVLLRKAEENLSNAQKDVDQQLRDYRESLITYAYEQALVRQKLDTNISSEEIEAYYQENLKNFELTDNIVRVRWFKLRETDKRVLKKVEDLWRSSDPERRHELEVLIAQRGSTINDTHDDWMAFSELQQQVPLRPDNPTDWIPRQSQLIVADSVSTYFVDFVEHRLKNSTSPLDLIRAEIRSILINQRKLRLIKRMREDLFQDALAKKDVRIRSPLLLAALLVSVSLLAQPRGQVIDQVVANVAGRIIMYSELAGHLEQERQGGTAVTDAMACAQLEDLLYQELLLEQARIDSVVVDDKRVEAELERRMRYFEQQIGGREKLEKFYGKPEERIKSEFRDQVREQLLAQQMQETITGEVSVTPKEVENFYKDIPKDSMPFINAGVEFGRIVRYAKPSAEEDRRVKKKMEDLRTRIVEGKVTFEVAATLNSQDDGSAKNGGILGMVPQGVMVPEFDAVALSLKDGEVSQVFKTEYGYHIMNMVERRGEQYNARHILLKLESSPEDVQQAKHYLDSVSTLIRDGKVTFTKAASEMNDDEETKGTNGLVIEPDRNSPRWAIGDLDQQTFFVLDKLATGTLSVPQYFEGQGGEKGYRVFLLMKRSEPHTMDLVADYPLVSEAAANAVRQHAVDNWVRERLVGVYVHIIPDYAGCPFKHNWIAPPGE